MRTLYRAARIHQPSDRPLTAFVVDGGTIAWTGPAGDDPGPVDATVDLGDDALVTPGFVDAHAHVTETGLLLRGVDLQDARSVTDLLARVEAAAASGRGPVLGHGWDETRLAEGRPPTRAELDRAGGGAAVYLSRVDVHSAVVSSSLAAACGAAGLDGWDDDGRVERDAHHAARHATRHGLPPAERREAQLAALRSAAARGVVAVHEMSAPHIAPDEDLRALAALTVLTGAPDRPGDGGRPGDAAGALPEITAYLGELVDGTEQLRAVLARVGVPLAGLAGDLCIDGSVGSRTAALREDYLDAAGSRGHQYLTVDQIRDHVAACTRAGLQAGFHAIGDAAVHAARRGFRRAAEQVGIAAVRRARHRVEHVECVDREAVADLADLGVTASVQPAFDAFWGGPDGMYATRLGAARALAMNPLAALAAAGVPLALGSDSPVTPVDPWGAIRACAHHHVKEQRIDPVLALDAHTRGAWRAAGVDGAGALTVGAPAHVAVWTVPGGFAADGLPDLTPGLPLPECLLTLGRGRVLHSAL